MRELVVLSLVVLALVGAAEKLGAQSNDVEVGEFSCAQFPSDLTEEYLVEAFGRENVTDEGVFGFDDGPVPGTVVFGDDPIRRIEVAWGNAQAKANPIWVRIREEATSWQTPDGIGVGMTLKEVEALNGWPFRLGGFLLEQGQGLVRSWGSGSLTESEEPDCPLRVQFQPRRHEDAEFSLNHELGRGNDFSSGHFAMQGVNPLVVGLWILYGP